MYFMLYTSHVSISILGLGDLSSGCVILTMLVAALATGRTAWTRERAGVIGTRAAMATFAMSVGMLVLVIADAGNRGAIFGIDRLSAVMLVLVTGVSALVHAFATSYMDSDPRYARFFGWLSFVSACVCTVVLANNFIVLAMGWVGTSIGLYHLQTHYRERPAALAAARLMRRSHQVGDVALVAACVVLALVCGTMRIDAALAEATSLSPVVATSAVALLAIAALSKSAQIPLHRWLPENMEAPTPVSALMHAGIVNVGGFLLARFSLLVVHAPAVAVVIFLVGSGTALWGTACMLVRPDVKRGLAYSTMGQMGYMTLAVRTRRLSRRDLPSRCPRNFQGNALFGLWLCRS